MYNVEDCVYLNMIS